MRKQKQKRIDLKQDGNDSTFYNDRLETELVQELSELNLNLGLPHGRKKIRENLPSSDWKSDPPSLTCPVSDFQIREARNLSDFNSEQEKVCHAGLHVGSFVAEKKKRYL